MKAAVVDRESKVQSVQEHVGEESLAADPEGPLHSLAAKGPELLQNDIHKWRYLSTLQCHSPSGIDTRTLDFDLNVFKAIASRGEEETTPLTAISVATVEVVQSLVNEGMAFYVTRSAVPAVHHRDEFGVGFLISPERPADSKGYVVVSDLVGNRINTAILEKVSGGYKLVWTSQNSGDWFDESQSLDYRLSVLKDVRTQRRANDFVDIFIKEPKQIAALEGIAAAGTFVLHMIPGGAFADHAAQGEWGEATLALAGDAALLVGGPLKAMAAARGWAKTARGFQLAAVSIEGTIGTVRLGQSAYAFYDGDNAQAAGYLGEAFLRLYGVKVAIKKPPVGKPEFTPPVDDVRVKPGLTGQALKSHTNAARAEEELARILHSLPDEAVVRWGDKIGKHGNDVITVNWKTGDVKLWDVKYRSGDVRVQPSKTFTDPARRANAILEAIDTLKTNTTLSPEIRDKALQNLVDGRIKYRTVGDGKAKNSILHEYL